MSDNPRGAMNQILNHGAKPLPLHRALCRCLSLTDSLLPEKAQNVVCDHSQLQHQLVGVELAGGQSLHPHIGLDFTVELLTHSVIVVQVDQDWIRFQSLTFATNLGKSAAGIRAPGAAEFCAL